MDGTAALGWPPVGSRAGGATTTTSSAVTRCVRMASKPGSRRSPVEGLDDAVELAAGFSHMCARRRSGGVACWGRNEAGQLGNGTTERARGLIDVPSLADVVDLAVGSYHACALRGDGTVLCWGQNHSGQLGSGTQEHQLTPGPIEGLTDVVELAGQGAFTCARQETGRVRCWGMAHLCRPEQSESRRSAVPVEVDLSPLLDLM